MQHYDWKNAVDSFGNIHANDKRIINTNANFIETELEKNVSFIPMEHQIYDIDAMMQLENHHKYLNEKRICDTHIGVLSEPYGSGKTFIIMGLIACQQVPPNKTIMKNIKIRNCSFVVEQTYKNVVNPTLIFCSATVLVQWEEAIKNNTNFKYYVISDVWGLRKLYKVMKENVTSLSEYNIILIKNKHITVNFEFDGYIEPKVNNKRHKNIIYLLSNMSINLGITWGRVILDDFDTIYDGTTKIYSSFPPALFTWLVSGSFIDVKFEIDSMTNVPLETFLDHFSSPSEMKLVSLNRYNVSCDIKFTEKCVNTGVPEFRICEFINPAENAIKLISMFGDNNSTIKMLNSDAIETAAANAGIKCTNVNQIFEKLLADKYVSYKRAADMEAFINKNAFNNQLPSPPIFMDRPSPTYDIFDLRSFRKIEYNYPDLEHILNDEKIKCIQEKEKSGKAIKRVKDNIEEGVCEICSNDIEAETAIINKCCGVLLCGICGVSISLKNRKCDKCRFSPLGVDDVIFIGEGFDLTNIVQDNFDYSFDREIIITELPQEKKATKIETLIKILNDEIPPYQVKKIRVDKKVLMGTKQLPFAPNEERRYVIFASFNEAINDIIKKLNDEKISFITMKGTAHEMGRILEDFNDGKIKVLLLKTSKNCAGINLQFATDIIFTHKIMESGLEGQAIGRMQRIARKYRATIWYLLYQNEVQQLVFI